MGLREQDIEKLIDGVYEMSTVYTNNPDGPDEVSCVFCGVYKNCSGDGFISMHDLSHEKDCVWLITQDLLHKEEKYKLDLL